jgi:hypothetical protein
MDIDSLTELMALSIIAIDAFTYTPVAANGPVPMPVGFRGRIKVVIAMTNDMSRTLGDDVDLRTVTRQDFDNYRVSEYRLYHPLGVRIAIQQQQQQQAGAAHAGGGMTPAEQFERAIKKDMEHYKEFKNEKQFDMARRNMESTAHTHGTFQVLDPTYVPDPNASRTSCTPFGKPNSRLIRRSLLSETMKPPVMHKQFGVTYVPISKILHVENFIGRTCCVTSRLIAWKALLGRERMPRTLPTGRTNCVSFIV